MYEEILKLEKIRFLHLKSNFQKTFKHCFKKLDFFLKLTNSHSCIKSGRWPELTRVKFILFSLYFYGPGQTLLGHTNVSGFFCTVCVNEMLTNVEQNKTYNMYFEIFNQIMLTRWVCFTMNEISFNEVTENFCLGTSWPRRLTSSSLLLRYDLICYRAKKTALYKSTRRLVRIWHWKLCLSRSFANVAHKIINRFLYRIFKKEDFCDSKASKNKSVPFSKRSLKFSNALSPSRILRSRKSKRWFFCDYFKF